jgi:hypothetical protein
MVVISTNDYSPYGIACTIVWHGKWSSCPCDDCRAKRRSADSHSLLRRRRGPHQSSGIIAKIMAPMRQLAYGRSRSRCVGIKGR